MRCKNEKEEKVKNQTRCKNEEKVKEEINEV